ncbi:prephenate dehydrogenase [Alteribacillus iranensis]|uniref:Prephenate dehydrogenase n=1 Tax=Alteribacillus iranensis TaxID=930128 RepID=A0A1I2BAG6_9BACI|nr:prephenate dehydrogenase [Alteribacillus iranensis]SFE53202.1 prephenate dehydrogenase [Alteribacillus iranensis]
MIDEAATDFSQAAERSDLIVLATPVRVTETFIHKLADLSLKEHVIVTDVGSTKMQIVREAEQLTKRGVTFIGGHPMSGSHRSGVGAARPDLFQAMRYVLTPSAGTSSQKVTVLKEWLKGMEAEFVELTPERHDKLAATVSHLPRVVAATLVQQTRRASSDHAIAMELAAGGFRDTTRIASSNPPMWRDILLHNKDNILHLLDGFQNKLTSVEKMVEREDSTEILEYFQTIKAFRDSFSIPEQHANSGEHELLVKVPEGADAIARVSAVLGKAGINITAIDMVDEESAHGMLRIVFRTEVDRMKSIAHLENANVTCILDKTEKITVG